ncbi:MAG: type I 3-dehydroquinate dehydratase [bacterium]
MKKWSICAVTMGSTMDELIHQVLLAQKEADLVEMRIDFLIDQKNINLKPLSKLINKDVIITCRRRDEGGRWGGTETNRLRILCQAFELGFAFVDVELRTLEEGLFTIPKKMKTKVIVSFHDFTKTPPIAKMKKIMERMQIFNPDIKKIATMVNSEINNITLFQIMLDKKMKEEICIVGMGKLGKKTRIIAPLLGGSFIYCSINGKSSAPGQISCKEIKEIYRLIS